MKTMWCSEGGVSMVAVREESGVLLACEDADECWWEATPGTLHETEVEARRAWLRAQEAWYENAIHARESEIQELHEQIKGATVDMEGLMAERQMSASLLAGVRAQLAELDAVEGRR